jgi:hypothetical protein
MLRLRERPARPGNALIEFLLTLPIVFFLTGLVIYMAMAMLTKQQTVIQARDQLVLNHWSWPPMELDPSWTGTSAGNADHPRGGDDPALDRLKPEVEPQTIAQVSSPQARDYWRRLWGNLPARQQTSVSKSFEAQGSMWNFLDKTATSDQFADQNEWRNFAIDCWKIARSGPLHPIFQSFWDNLGAGGDVGRGGVMPNSDDPFQRTRDDIINRWFHGGDILNPALNAPKDG